MRCLKYFSMFSGIGGFELGINQAYEDCRLGLSKPQAKNIREAKSDPKGRQMPRPVCVGFSEVDRHASKIYEARFKQANHLCRQHAKERGRNARASASPNRSHGQRRRTRPDDLPSCTECFQLHRSYGDCTTIKPARLPKFDLICAAFLAKVSQLLASGEDLQIQEALYSLRSLESLGLKNRAIYSLRMSKDSCPTMRAIPLRQSSAPLMNWGMTVNGKCLTAKTSASPRVGSECSLSDILETQVDRKYFLSRQTVEKMLKFNQRKISKGHGFRVSIQDMDSGGAGKDISEWASSK